MQKTKKQWLAEGYVVNEGATGTVQPSKNAFGRCHCYRYYSEEEVTHDPEQAKAIRKENRVAAEEKRREKERRQAIEDARIDKLYEEYHTAYQWNELGRVVKPGAKVYSGDYLIRRYNLNKGSGYSYYHISDTEERP